MAIITISGRRVKRLAKQTCAARPAKALAPWAGPGYWLTESGEAAMAEQEAFQRQQSLDLRQAAYRALGLSALADVREIKRRYFASDGYGEAGQRYVAFDGGTEFKGMYDNSVTVVTTSDADHPLACVYRGPDVSLPPEVFEMAAQLWLGLGGI